MGPWPAPGFQGFLSFIGLPAKPLTYFFHGSQGPAVALDTGDCSGLTAAAGLALFVEGKLKLWLTNHIEYNIPYIYPLFKEVNCPNKEVTS